MEILNTKLFNASKNNDEFWMKAAREKVEAAEKAEAESLECCEKSMAAQGKKCCKSQSKDGKLLDSGLSQVLISQCYFVNVNPQFQVQLDVVPNNLSAKDRKTTRHEARFGITSFIYRARRPFHPGRLRDIFLEPYFVSVEHEEDEEEEKMSESDKLAKLKSLKRRRTRRR